MRSHRWNLCGLTVEDSVLIAAAAAKLLQLCPALCDPTEGSPPGSSVHGDSPGKNSGVGSLSLFQGIFLTQELNQGLLHCRQILYQLSYLGCPTKGKFHAKMGTIKDKNART